MRTILRVALVTVALALCSGCGEQDETVASMNEATLIAWGKKTIDCSVPGMGVELALPPTRSDITGDGTRDVIASFECVTGDASSFSHVVALDGGSAANNPKVIGTLIRMAEGKDYRQALKSGAKVRRVAVKGSVITVVADKWRYTDAKACPSLKYVQIFTVKESVLVAQKATELEVPGC
ncbi:hypothetical protein [Streptomyces sp. NBC_01538]|uniref:hypothetical protein n=1 Tax=Streptomyces sp. NBC_01538 TaxID=2903897 RepID=UPI003863D7D1